MSSTHTRTYVLGHSAGELARLERQAEIFAEITENILRRAGIGRGMRILDIGCGVGDVSLAAARLVGPTGSVLGVDRSDDALETARRRASASAADWLSFRSADLHSLPDVEPFDAVIGRFILMYLTDPAASIASIAGHLKPGGIVAFIELEISQGGAKPELPLLSQVISWVISTYRRAGIEPNMGSKLYETFRKAGLQPNLVGISRIEGGPDAVAYDFAAETIRSLLPWMTEFGIATAREVDIDTLAERLRAAAVAGDHCIFLPRIVGAWARTG